MTSSANVGPQTTAGVVQIMSIFWEVTVVLEYTCNFPVISAVSDGVSQNKTFYRMHGGLDDPPDADIVYKTLL